MENQKVAWLKMCTQKWRRNARQYHWRHTCWWQIKGQIGVAVMMICYTVGCIVCIVALEGSISANQERYSDWVISFKKTLPLSTAWGLTEWFVENENYVNHMSWFSQSLDQLNWPHFWEFETTIITHQLLELSSLQRLVLVARWIPIFLLRHFK